MKRITLLNVGKIGFSLLVLLISSLGLACTPKCLECPATGEANASSNQTAVANSVSQTVAAHGLSTAESVALTVTAVSATQVAEQAFINTQTETLKATAVAITQELKRETPISPPSITPKLEVSLANVHVRSGPGKQFHPVDYLKRGDVIDVLAQNSAGDWFNIVLPNGFAGWIAASVTHPVNPSAMTNVPVYPVSYTIVRSIPQLPSSHPISQPDVVQLAHTSPANYGTVSLNHGFLPDPALMNISSNGNVDVEALQLGPDCTGFATSAPDLSLNWSLGGEVLSLYFEAESNNDATLIIHDPVGNWHCNDDFGDSLNPGIEFNNSLYGHYDIWIGNFNANEQISGKLRISEFALP